MNKPTLYDLQKYDVHQGTLLIAVETDHDLTRNRVYVTTRDQGNGTFPDCVWVVNDKGKELDYSSELFSLYEGEVLSRF